MIMQHNDGDIDFFSDVLRVPRTSALAEIDAPMDDWRFLPRNAGRLFLRNDLAHETMVHPPLFFQSATHQTQTANSTEETLFFG